MTDSRSREAEIDSHVQRLIEVYVRTISALEQSINVLQAELSTLSEHQTSQIDRNNQTRMLPFVNRSALSVVHQGRSCPLGNTLMFRFIDCLIQRPNHYYTHRDLLLLVWEAHRDLSSVRSVVRELRTKLRDAGLNDMADAIDGSVRGHYALLLDRLAASIPQKSH